MALLKPVVTYALAAVLVLWVLLGAVTLPNANRWFRGSGYSIQEDIVMFNGTISVNNSVLQEYGKRDFKSSIYPIDNTPPVPSQGIQGVLYDLGEACGLDPNVIPMPEFAKQHNISKIALIQQSKTCFLTDKIRFAQLDGAIAVVVYHNGSNGYDTSARFYGMGVMPKSVSIPAYYIELNTGLVLLRDLENVLKLNGENPQKNVVNRITLSPSSKPVLDHWQFALVVVGVMLLTSIVAISVLQCHMWRMAQNRNNNASNASEILTAAEQQQITMDENFWRGIIGQPPRPLIVQTQRKRQRLDQALVNLLPTRIFQEREKPEKSAHNLSVDSFGTTCELTACVICLDNFETGDVLRRLPCQHEYHRDCIDVWLTKKCGSCPLCQQSIEIPTVPDEIHARAEEEESQMYDDMPDLAETWTGMERDRQVAMRQSPMAGMTETDSSQPLENRQENYLHHHNPYPPI